MERASIRRISLSLALGISACGGDEDERNVACTTDIKPALSIRVVDATGNAIAAGATATVTDGPFSQTVQNPTCDGCLLSAANERVGVYSVVVSKAGYQDFTASNIVVTANRCHVNTVTVTALMVP